VQRGDQWVLKVCVVRLRVTGIAAAARKLVNERLPGPQTLFRCRSQAAS
jgi:hypothetical protein